MDKITKVQEISSFIRHFDNKNWNEIILRLTIIGIRYIKNYCQYFFKWKMEDLLLISDQLKQNKFILINNFKSNFEHNNQNYNSNNFNRNENNLYKYNYNYSNTAFFKKDSKDKSNNKNNKKNHKSKSLLNRTSLINNHSNKKYNINNNINDKYYLNLNNNNSSLKLSDRESPCFNSNNNENRKSFEKIKENNIKKVQKTNINLKKNQQRNDETIKYFEEKDDQKRYLKNKKYNNRNKILSLNNKESFNNKNMDMNVIISDFPFSNNNIGHYNENKINNNIENNLKYHNLSNSEIINTFNNSSILQKTYNLNYLENEKDKNNNYLIDEIKKQKDYFNNSSTAFISELRKLNHSKDNNKKRLSNNFHHSQSLNLMPSMIGNNNENNNKLNLNYTNNFDIMNNNLNVKDNIKNNINILNNNDKESIFNISYDNINNKENILSKTDNRNYDIELKNAIFDTKNFYTNNSIDRYKNNKINYNKYLRNPNYKNSKSRSNSIDDLNHKINNNNRTYVCSSEKENENNIISNTDRYPCHYIYESKPNLNNENTNIINRNNYINNYKI